MIRKNLLFLLSNQKSNLLSPMTFVNHCTLSCTPPPPPPSSSSSSSICGIVYLALCVSWRGHHTGITCHTCTAPNRHHTQYQSKWSSAVCVCFSNVCCLVHNGHADKVKARARATCERTHRTIRRRREVTPI